MDGLDSSDRAGGPEDMVGLDSSKDPTKEQISVGCKEGHSPRRWQNAWVEGQKCGQESLTEWWVEGQKCGQESLAGIEQTVRNSHRRAGS